MDANSNGTARVNGTRPAAATGTVAPAVSEPTRAKFSLPEFSPEDAERKRLAREQEATRQAAVRRSACWERVVQRIGRRYADCTLDSFEVSRERGVAPKQRAILARLKAFVGLIDQEVSIGRNLALFGPVGTGKDHLLACAMRAACQAGFDVEWVNGMDLFGAVRDQMDTEQSEARLLSQWIGPAVLAISDPLPPWGALTPFQAATLFRIVDRRYRDRKPIWITGNFKDGAEAEERIGIQAIDRIRDGALDLLCDWPSYRRSAE